MVPRHTLRPTRPPPYSLLRPTASASRSRRTVTPPRRVSPSTLTRHGVRTRTPPPHATHSHATPLLPPLVSRLSPPLPPSTRHRRRRLRATAAAVYVPPPPPSTRLSLDGVDAHAPWRTHTHTSTTRNPQPHYTTAATTRLLPVTATAAIYAPPPLPSTCHCRHHLRISPSMESTLMCHGVCTPAPPPHAAPHVYKVGTTLRVCSALHPCCLIYAHAPPSCHQDL